MPILEKGKLETKSLIGINHIKEIIPDIQNIKKALKRVDIKREEGIKSYDEIAKEISHSKKILCIVNTRKIAKEIFDRLPQDGFKIHLSRMMCPCSYKRKNKRNKRESKRQKMHHAKSCGYAVDRSRC
jgi:CRISPR/Cas system-associated endonuclease/helicase Cas3